jgi:hypothetical protein
MADTLLTFLEKTAKMEGELRNFERNMVLVTAQAVKTSVQTQMGGAGVQNGKLRGVGKKGAKIGVRYDLVGETALVRATGPFHLIERDTKAHREPKVRGSRARKRLLVIPGVGVRASANHPGTKGKHPWAKGVLVAVPIAERAGGIALGKSIVKAYR